MNESAAKAKGAERRRSYRLTLNDGDAVVKAGSQIIPISDISASGSSLLVGDSIPTSLMGQSKVILAGDDWFEAQLLPVRSRARGSEWELGTRFFSLDEASLGRLFRFYAPRFAEQNRWMPEKALQNPGMCYSDALFIRRLLQYHAGDNQRPIHVYDGRILLPLTLLLEQSHWVSQPTLHLVVSQGDGRLLELGQKYHFTFAGAGGLNDFVSEVISASGPSVEISIPTQLKQSGYRDSRRFDIFEEDTHVVFRDPRFSREIRATVKNVSGGGFSMTLSGDTHTLFPGDSLPDTVLRFPNADVRLTATIRNVIEQKDARMVGVEISQFHSSEDANLWHSHVLNLFNVPVSLAGSQRSGEAWRVLESSNYVEMWTTPEQRARLKRRFSVAWPGINSSTGHLLLMEDAIGPYATIAQTLLYPRTWIIHHLGVDEQRRQDRPFFFESTRQLHAALTYAMQHMSNADYFAWYYEKGLRWNSLMYENFMGHSNLKDKMLYDDYKVFKANTANVDQSLNFDQDLKFQFETPEALDQLSQHLERTVTPVEFAAYNFERSEITLEKFTAQCRKNGFERSRRVIFARRDNQRIAAAIIETGDDGVNIFGLFNKVRIISLTEDEVVEPSVRDALIRRSARFYSKCGKQQFLYFAHSAVVTDEVAALGLNFVSDGCRWIAHRDVVSPWLNYLEDTFGAKLVERRG